MAKRKFNLTQNETLELKVAYDQCKNATLGKKLLAVRLYGNQRKVDEIRDLSSCSRSSLMNWVKQYQTQGIEGLKDQRPGGNHYRLSSEEKAMVKEILHQYKPKQILGGDCATISGEFWTVADLKILIFKQFEVIYKSPSSYWLIFTQLGFTYQRTERIFKSRSELKVADFEERLEKN